MAAANGTPARDSAAAFEAAGPAGRLPFDRTGVFTVTTLLLNNLILRDGLARARAEERRLEDAIAIYRGLLRADRESKFTALYEPRYVLAIARLLGEIGKEGTSASSGHRRKRRR